MVSPFVCGRRVRPVMSTLRVDVNRVKSRAALTVDPAKVSTRGRFGRKPHDRRRAERDAEPVRVRAVVRHDVEPHPGEVPAQRSHGCGRTERIRAAVVVEQRCTRHRAAPVAVYLHNAARRAVTGVTGVCFGPVGPVRGIPTGRAERSRQPCARHRAGSLRAHRVTPAIGAARSPVYQPVIGSPWSYSNGHRADGAGVSADDTASSHERPHAPHVATSAG